MDYAEFWTDERDAALKAAWDAGDFMREIALSLGCSRNFISRRAQHLNLRSRGHGIVKPKAPTPAPYRPGVDPKPDLES